MKQPDYSFLKNTHTFIVAEAGVNHNGDLSIAKKLIDTAADSKADAVKFQTWKPGEITGKFTHKVDYLTKTTSPGETRYELSNRLALSYDSFRTLQRYAMQKGILFLSTPDGYESLDFLVDELDIPVIKIGSTEITNVQYLKAIASKDRPIILSTGMSNLGEVERAISVIRCETQKPLVLLHCTSQYPVSFEEINLRSMVTMRNAFQLPVGLSDHSTGKEAAIAAVALGASVIEKHFTIDKKMEGPDHQASLNPSELHDFIESIRKTETLLGSGVKQMTYSEKKNVANIRRSIVLKYPISKGTVITREMLACKRPGTGIEPAAMEIVIGMTINKDMEEDEPLMWKYVK